jgi:thiol-disulfide isomerase/thioredoxin
MAASEPRAKLGKGLGLAIVAALVVGAGGVLYVLSGTLKPASAPDLQSLATGGIAKLQVSKPAPPPATPFKNADGKDVTLQSMAGGVMLVNIWATWCGPCVKEMPTLAALEKEYGPKGLKVIPVSVDREKDTDAAKAFIAKHAPLPFYQDAKTELPFALNPPALGYPTSILYDKKGVERARVVGEADWSSPEAKAVIDRLLVE